MKNQNMTGGCTYLLGWRLRCLLHPSSSGGFAYNMTNTLKCITSQCIITLMQNMGVFNG